MIMSRDINTQCTSVTSFDLDVIANLEVNSNGEGMRAWTQQKHITKAVDKLHRNRDPSFDLKLRSSQKIIQIKSDEQQELEDEVWVPIVIINSEHQILESSNDDYMVEVQPPNHQIVEVPRRYIEIANPTHQEQTTQLQNLLHINLPNILQALQYNYEQYMYFLKAGSTTVYQYNDKSSAQREMRIRETDQLRVFASQNVQKSMTHFGRMRQGSGQSFIFFAGQQGSGKESLLASTLRQYVPGYEKGFSEKLVHAFNIIKAFTQPYTVRDDDLNLSNVIIKIFQSDKKISGAQFSVDLLQECRITRTEEGEVSYKIFNMFYYGLLDEQKIGYNIPSVKNLSQNNLPGPVSSIRNEKDLQNISDSFKQLLNSLKVFGFKRHFSQIFRILSGLVSLSTIQVDDLRALEKWQKKNGGLQTAISLNDNSNSNNTTNLDRSNSIGVANDKTGLYTAAANLNMADRFSNESSVKSRATNSSNMNSKKKKEQNIYIQSLQQLFQQIGALLGLGKDKFLQLCSEMDQKTGQNFAILQEKLAQLIFRGLLTWLVDSINFELQSQKEAIKTQQQSTHFLICAVESNIFTPSQLSIPAPEKPKTSPVKSPNPSNQRLNPEQNGGNLKRTASNRSTLKNSNTFKDIKSQINASLKGIAQLQPLSTELVAADEQQQENGKSSNDLMVKYSNCKPCEKDGDLTDLMVGFQQSYQQAICMEYSTGEYLEFFQKQGVLRAAYDVNYRESQKFWKKLFNLLSICSKNYPDDQNGSVKEFLKRINSLSLQFNFIKSVTDSTDCMTGFQIQYPEGDWRTYDVKRIMQQASTQLPPSILSILQQSTFVPIQAIVSRHLQRSSSNSQSGLNRGGSNQIAPRSTSSLGSNMQPDPSNIDFNDIRNSAFIQELLLKDYDFDCNQVGHQNQNQANNLLVHFVQCINPLNVAKLKNILVRGEYSTNQVQKQLIQTSLIGALQIEKLKLFRAMHFSDFLRKYADLFYEYNLEKQKTKKQFMLLQKMCRMVLSQMPNIILNQDYMIGTTQIFLKPELLSSLELIKTKYTRCILAIQIATRRWLKINHKALLLGTLKNLQGDIGSKSLKEGREAQEFRGGDRSFQGDMKPQSIREDLDSESLEDHINGNGRLEEGQEEGQEQKSRKGQLIETDTFKPQLFSTVIKNEIYNSSSSANEGGSFANDQLDPDENRSPPNGQQLIDISRATSHQEDNADTSRVQRLQSQDQARFLDPWKGETDKKEPTEYTPKLRNFPGNVGKQLPPKQQQLDSGAKSQNQLDSATKSQQLYSRDKQSLNSMTIAQHKIQALKRKMTKQKLIIKQISRENKALKQQMVRSEEIWLQNTVQLRNYLRQVQLMLGSQDLLQDYLQAQGINGVKSKMKGYGENGKLSKTEPNLSSLQLPNGCQSPKSHHYASKPDQVNKHSRRFASPVRGHRPPTQPQSPSSKPQSPRSKPRSPTSMDIRNYNINKKDLYELTSKVSQISTMYKSQLYDQQRASSQNSNRFSKAQFLKIKNEFERKQRMYEDDINFIEEVLDGRSMASVDMDPEVALKQLKERVENWRNSFYHKLKHVRSHSRQNVSGASFESMPSLSIHDTNPYHDTTIISEIYSPEQLHQSRQSTISFEDLLQQSKNAKENAQSNSPVINDRVFSNLNSLASINDSDLTLNNTTPNSRVDPQDHSKVKKPDVHLETLPNSRIDPPIIPRSPKVQYADQENSSYGSQSLHSIFNNPELQQQQKQEFNTQGVVSSMNSVPQSIKTSDNPSQEPASRRPPTAEGTQAKDPGSNVDNKQTGGGTGGKQPTQNDPRSVFQSSLNGSVRTSQTDNVGVVVESNLTSMTSTSKQPQSNRKSPQLSSNQNKSSSNKTQSKNKPNQNNSVIFQHSSSGMNADAQYNLLQQQLQKLKDQLQVQQKEPKEPLKDGLVIKTPDPQPQQLTSTSKVDKNTPGEVPTRTPTNEEKETNHNLQSSTSFYSLGSQELNNSFFKNMNTDYTYMDALNKNEKTQVEESHQQEGPKSRSQEEEEGSPSQPAGVRGKPSRFNEDRNSFNSYHDSSDNSLGSSNSESKEGREHQDIFGDHILKQNGDVELEQKSMQENISQGKKSSECNENIRNVQTMVVRKNSFNFDTPTQEYNIMKTFQGPSKAPTPMSRQQSAENLQNTQTTLGTNDKQLSTIALISHFSTQDINKDQLAQPQTENKNLFKGKSSKFAQRLFAKRNLSTNMSTDPSSILSVEKPSEVQNAPSLQSDTFSATKSQALQSGYTINQKLPDLQEEALDTKQFKKHKRGLFAFKNRRNSTSSKLFSNDSKLSQNQSFNTQNQSVNTQKSLKNREQNQSLKTLFNTHGDIKKPQGSFLKRIFKGKQT